jgi:hypothetical protein
MIVLNDFFWIRKVPDVMANLKYVEAQKLQERWFTADPFAFTLDYRSGKTVGFESLPIYRYDDEIVSISWALSFVKPHRAYAELLKNWSQSVPSLREGETRSRRKLMENAFAKNLQEYFLTKSGASAAKTSFVFGDLDAHPRILKSRFSVQRQPISMSPYPLIGDNDPIDGWYAACANASWELAVKANVEYLGNQRYSVTIVQCAVYLYDIFDFFNRDQLLGFWSRTGVSKWPSEGSLAPIPVKPPNVKVTHGYKVTNGSYDDYRKNWNKGGDFFIFSSDKRIFPVVPPVTFMVEV